MMSFTCSNMMVHIFLTCQTELIDSFGILLFLPYHVVHTLMSYLSTQIHNLLLVVTLPAMLTSL